MRGNRSSSRNVLLLAVVNLALVSATQAAPKYKILHAFGKGQDGAGLWGSLVLDAKGDSYGMTRGGGTTGYGTAFQLTPHRSGRWSETILYDFDCYSEGGCMPQAGPTLDAAGNLYGMATGGGNIGTVFQLSSGSGGWTLTLLHDKGQSANLILDQAGNVYGPMASNGQYGGGAISELVKADGWAEKWVYSFCPKHPCVDGAWPFAGVTWGPDGSLYGTTVEGGSGGGGVVYRLTPQQDGTWKETVLHSFPAFKNDGYAPYQGVVLDKSGNLYGATYQGGSRIGCGVIFKLAPQANGKWKETILYNFPTLSQGCIANTMALDAQGNPWGTAQSGGTSSNGVVFKLTPQQSGKWKYQVVHQFNWKDGSLPGAAVIFDNQGNLYGTTILGGAYGGGVIFELTP